MDTFSEYLHDKSHSTSFKVLTVYNDNNLDGWLCNAMCDRFISTWFVGGEYYSVADDIFIADVDVFANHLLESAVGKSKLHQVSDLVITEEDVPVFKFDLIICIGASIDADILKYLLLKGIPILYINNDSGDNDLYGRDGVIPSLIDSGYRYGEVGGSNWGFAYFVSNGGYSCAHLLTNALAEFKCKTSLHRVYKIIEFCDLLLINARDHYNWEVAKALGQYLIRVKFKEHDMEKFHQMMTMLMWSDTDDSWLECLSKEMK